MRSTDVLQEAYGRIGGVVHSAVEGLDADQLAYRPTETSNSIAWLVWHLTRIQDDHIADVAGSEQIWTAAGWTRQFGLPLEVSDTGFGHSPEDVAAVRVSDGSLLRQYYDAVYEQTRAYLQTLTDDALHHVIDESWDPPVTLGVRLVSVIGDNLQHAGQAAYLRGLITA